MVSLNHDCIGERSLNSFLSDDCDCGPISPNLFHPLEPQTQYFEASLYFQIVLVLSPFEIGPESSQNGLQKVLP